jgi:hypothetical protein
MLVIVIAELMATISSGHKVKVINRCRIQSSIDSLSSGATDGTRGKPKIKIGVIQGRSFEALTI